MRGIVLKTSVRTHVYNHTPTDESMIDISHHDIM